MKGENMNEERCEEWIDAILRAAKENYAVKKRSGNGMTFLLLLENGDTAVVDNLPTNTPRVKDSALLSLKQVVKEGRGAVAAIAVITEAWMTKVAEGAAYLPPSKSPNRQEILLIAYESRHHKKTITVPILQDNTLGEPEIMDIGSEKGEGRFSNLGLYGEREERKYLSPESVLATDRVNS